MFTIGIVISAGMGVQHLDRLPAIPGCDVIVDVIAFSSPPSPADSPRIKAAAYELQDEGADIVCLIGSSRGVAPAQLALSEEPELFDRYVAISGTGGPVWGVEDFIRGVTCPVLQMAGEDEQERLLERMDLLHFYLQKYGRESEMQRYPGRHGFLVDSKEAQRDLVNFLCVEPAN